MCFLSKRCGQLYLKREESPRRGAGKGKGGAQRGASRDAHTMGDVVKMQVFLVGDPSRGGRMDFAGFMQGYTQFFGTVAQPHLPVRSALQVMALANPGFLVEIEVTAVRP